MDASKYIKLSEASFDVVAGVLKNTAIDPADKRGLFFLSTNKGNGFLVDENECAGYEDDRIYVWRSAELLVGFFGTPNQPLIVSNARISGASAMIAAQR